MLYDNAQLIRLVQLGLCGNREMNCFGSESKRRSIGFGGRWCVAGGGFAASLDADSEGEEGAFYTWTEDEVRHRPRGPIEPASLATTTMASHRNWEGEPILTARI